MNSKILTLYKTNGKEYSSIFRNNHGRIIFMSIILVDGFLTITECFYLDRVVRPEPKKLTTIICKLSSLLDVIKNELDKSFKEIEWDDSVIMSKEALISTHMAARKPKILIMLADNNGVIRTIFKSKFRREIYLEIALSGEGNIATISKCYYVDKRAKGMKIPPQGLITVRFEFSLKNLLEIVNTELEGGFTDVLISSPHHTITLERPICGAI